MNKKMLVWLVFACTGAWAQDAIYRCGNVYTNNALEAQAQGCKKIEGSNVTVIQAPKLNSGAASAGNAAGGGGNNTGSTRPAGTTRVDSTEQRNRDLDARNILEGELAKAQTKLADLQKEYNSGEPERRGDERNYQKYLDRTDGLKREVTRAQADVESLKRELARLPANAQR